MDSSSQTGGGMIPTFRRLLQTLGETAVNRFELFALEWREERLRMLDMLLLIVAGSMCLLMTLILVTFAVVACFWDTHRLLVLSLVIVAYACGAGGVFWSLRSRLRAWKSFAETVEQFKQDGSCFKAKK